MFWNVQNLLGLILSKSPDPTRSQTQFISLQDHVCKGNGYIDRMHGLSTCQPCLRLRTASDNDHRRFADKRLSEGSLRQFLPCFLVSNNDKFPILAVARRRGKPCSLQY